MDNQNLKRSNEPTAWLLFSAGGMVSAICFPVLILLFGILIPFGIVDMGNIVSFSHYWLGKLIILAITIFPMWGGMHRVHHGLHDFKIHLPASGLIFYGLAFIYSLAVIFAVIRL